MASSIKITDFSNGSIKSSVIDGINHHEWQGTAIFDVLMQSVNSNLKIQFDNGRIVGPDYAQVYMASIQSCIEEAMKFLLNKDLTAAQLAKLNAEKGLIEAQLAAYPAQAAKELEIKQAELAKIQAEKALLDAQLAAVKLDEGLKQAQIDKLTADKDLIDAQTTAYPDQAKKDLDVKQANIELLNRQKEGFNDNKHQKLFEAQMNAWALMFSSGLLETKPSIISNDSASALYNTLKPK